MAEDVTQERIEVNHVARLGRVAQDDHHQLVGREDEDVLTVVAVTIEHVLRHIREFATTVQPEERAVAALAGSCRLARIVHPPFRQYPLAAHATVVEVQLSEAGEIQGCGIEVRRAHRRAAHVLLEDGTDNAQRCKKPRVHIAEESLIR